MDRGLIVAVRTILAIAIALWGMGFAFSHSQTRRFLTSAMENLNLFSALKSAEDEIIGRLLLFGASLLCGAVIWFCRRTG